MTHKEVRGLPKTIELNRWETKHIQTRQFIQRLFVCLGLKQSAGTANLWQSNTVIQRSQEVKTVNEMVQQHEDFYFILNSIRCHNSLF